MNSSTIVMNAKKEKIDAQHIKAQLADFLLSRGQCDLMVAEAPFLWGDRRADFINILGNITTGFEIKSEYDSLKSLQSQLLDYKKVFNLVYIVLAEKFAKSSVLKDIPKETGIILAKRENLLTLKRKAMPKLALDKSALLLLLWRKDLEKLSPEMKGAEMETLREYALKNYSIKAIQQQVVTSLKVRYGESYRLFLKERGSHTTIKDLRLITGLKKNPVFCDTNTALSYRYSP